MQNKKTSLKLWVVLIIGYVFFAIFFGSQSTRVLFRSWRHKTAQVRPYRKRETAGKQTRAHLKQEQLGNHRSAVVSRHYKWKFRRRRLSAEISVENITTSYLFHYMSEQNGSVFPFSSPPRFTRSNTTRINFSNYAHKRRLSCAAAACLPLPLWRHRCYLHSHDSCKLQ